MSRSLLTLTVLLALTVPLDQSAAADLPAFPGAEGFGANTPGGRGGKVLVVTTLQDYLPGKEKKIAGSLRAACLEKGPRIVVFRVGGTIELKAGLKINEPFLTIAGQSAPGGICLKNYGLVIRDTHDIVIRHLRVRPGDVMETELDAVSVDDSQNVILDHCSVSWGVDETLSVTGDGCTNVTVQYCLISESLNNSAHAKGAHGYGSLIRTNGNVTYHHNIYAHHASRCPRPGTYGKGSILLDFRNNVIYDGKGYSAKDPVRMNYVGNYIKQPRGDAFRVGGEVTFIYAEGNVIAEKPELDDWSIIAGAQPGTKQTRPYPVAAVTTDTAPQVYAKLLKSCGAALPRRDAVDERVIKQIETGAGKLIDSQTEVGGWPVLASGTAPPDADADGLPDEWEKRHHLDPENPGDAALDPDGNGYTQIEEYLNSLGID